jgi:hypothetical protein
MVLTLQKLVHLHPDKEDQSDSESDDDGQTDVPRPSKGRTAKFFRKIFSGSKAKEKYDEKQKEADLVAGVHDPTNGYITGHTDGTPSAAIQKLRTLQRYHGGPNKERMTYMEAHSPLTKRKLAVSAEQVSIFLTAGRSFFQLRSYSC